METVTIEIPRMYAERLAHWASVGRTIDSTIHQLDTCECGNIEDILLIISELKTLKAPLDAMNMACKHWGNTQ